MHIYLEINETLIEKEQLTKQPLTLRLEVADKNKAIDKLIDVESLFIGRRYTKKVHYCKHEDGLPCVVEAL